MLIVVLVLDFDCKCLLHIYMLGVECHWVPQGSVEHVSGNICTQAFSIYIPGNILSTSLVQHVALLSNLPCGCS